MRVLNNAVLVNLDLSIDGASDPISLVQVYMYSLQVVLTGAPAGTIKLQVSNDSSQPNSSGKYVAPVNWTDVQTSVTTVAAARSIVWEDKASTYAWVRIVWTKSDGSTGAANARINTRGV